MMVLAETRSVYAVTVDLQQNSDSFAQFGCIA
jgi:hypothetical protein